MCPEDISYLRQPDYEDGRSYSCRGTLDQNKATIFELSNLGEFNFLFIASKSTTKYCLTVTNGLFGLIPTRVSIQLNACSTKTTTERVLWKYDRRQVYNKAKNALWWAGDNSNNYL